MPDDSVTTAARPSATRRGGGWWWVGAALAGVLAAVLVVVLVRQETRAPTQVTTDPARALLEREAVAAVHTWSDAIEKVSTTGDAAVLDDVFVPGSELDKTERKDAAVRARTGYLVDAGLDFAIVDVNVLELSATRAKVAGTTTSTASVLRNRRTGKVIRRDPAYRRQVEIELDRVDGHWLVARITAVGNPVFPEGG